MGNGRRSWMHEFDDAISNISSSLFTQNQFEDQLTALLDEEGSRLSAVTFHIQPLAPFGTITIGAVGPGAIDALETSTGIFTHALSGSHDRTCRIEYWSKPFANSKNSDTTDCTARLGSLIDAFWKGSLRDKMARIISMQYPETIELYEKLLSFSIVSGSSLGVIFLDVDKFKRVNDEINMAKGDEVILNLGAVLEVVADRTAIAIHRSGDEFLLLFPDASAEDVILLAREALDAVKRYNFDTDEIPIRLSAGAAVVSSEQRAISREAIEQLAEKAVKLEGGIKLRGKVRLSLPPAQVSPADCNDQALAKALFVIRCDPGTDSPFANPWLNLISRDVIDKCGNADGVDLSKIQATVDEFLGWIDPCYESGKLQASIGYNQEVDWDCRFSKLDVVLAVAFGLYRHILTCENADWSACSLNLVRTNIKGQSTNSLRLMPNDDIVFENLDDNVPNEHYNLGYFLKFKTSEITDLSLARRFSLVKIGHKSPPISEGIFADVLVVDDRPTRGGMLPDFWESALARLTAKVIQNPNVQRVYVVGNEVECGR